MNTEVIPPTESKADSLAARGSSAPNFRSPKESTEPDIALTELWRIARKRKAIILRVTLGLFALAVVGTVIQTPKFRAESTIEFSEENSDSLALNQQRPAQGDTTSMDYALLQKTQVKALLSDTLALRVIEELGMERMPEFTKKGRLAVFSNKHDEEYGLPLERAPYRRVKILNAFHKNLDVAAVPGTRLISIQFMSSDPRVSALVVNTLVKDYKDQYFQNRYTATVEASQWLSRQLDDLRTEVGSSQKKLVDYQKEAGILGTDESHNVVMTRLEEGAKQLMNAQQNRIVAQTIAELVRKGDPEAVSGLLGAVSASSSSQSSNYKSDMSPLALSYLQSLRSQQNQVRMEYAEAATHYGAANPKLLALKSRVDEMDGAIQQEIENLKLRAENDFIGARRTENALRTAFEDEKNEANQLNDSAVQYTILKHEVESSRTLYDGLLTKFKEAALLAGLRSSNIVVVDGALVPDRPARPIVLLNLSLGLMIGLFCGAGTAIVAENLDDTVGTAEEAEEVAGVMALGTVANWGIPSKRHAAQLAVQSGTHESSICVVGKTHSQSAEAFRAIRTSILQSTRPGISTPIVVTSASSAEGKSTVSLNCAAAFAQHGSRVLLVEADMRRPVLNAYLNIKCARGLSSMIQGESCDDLPFVLPSLPKLSVIPAGPDTSSPSELLGSERMKELIKKWRGEYDYIFLDTPPALSFTDAVVLAPACDLVVLVARANLTRRPALLRVSKTFARLRPRVLGVILNAANVDNRDFAAYYSHKSLPN